MTEKKVPGAKPTTKPSNKNVKSAEEKKTDKTAKAPKEDPKKKDAKPTIVNTAPKIMKGKKKNPEEEKKK